MSNVEKFRKFDSISHFDDYGNEFWSARDLAQLMGYSKWQHFRNAVERACVSLENQNVDVTSHVTEVRKLDERPQGGSITKLDYHLSRYGCYILFMNGDPRKPEVALAQAYFAMMTRVAEVEKLDESLEVQKKLTDRAVNRSLALEQRVSELEEVRRERNELLRALAKANEERDLLKSKMVNFVNSL